MKTTVPKRLNEQERKWHLVNADGLILGKLATKVADLLRGKHKPIFTPHMDMGDHVVVINAGKVKVTGTKEESKIYIRHTQYPGHLRMTPFKKMRQERPLRILEEAVKGMLPKNRLRDLFLKKLHLYEGTEHQHQAQAPEPLQLF
jgi:large subunit ribosomal protein L13